MKLYVNLFYWSWLLVSIVIVASDSSTKLLQNILTNYSSSFRPVLEGKNDAVDVTMNIQLIQLLSVEEINQIVKLACHYKISWTNHLLTWDPHQWGNIDKLRVRREDIWVPDIVLLNSVGPDDIQKDTDAVYIDNNGVNMWNPKVIFTTSFVADIKHFPFDMQRFTLTFESWSYDESELRIMKNNESMIFNYNVNNTQWSLLKTEKNIVSQIHGEDLSALMFTYIFVRKPTYFLTTLILPINIIFIIVLFSYFLPADCGERMGVMITVLLVFAVFLDVVATTLPQTSDSTPYISIYILLIMCLCTLSFFETCLVLTMFYNGHRKESLRPPLWIRSSVLKNKWRCDSIATTSALQYNNSYQGYSKTIIEPSGHFEQLRKHKMSLESMTIQSKELKEILKHVKTITKQQGYRNRNEREEAMKGMEWIQLAKMIDRISFWIFLLASVLSQGILIVLYKKYH